MINLKAIAKFKKMGGKWDGSEWIAPKLAKKEFDEIKKEFYEDLIVVEIKSNIDEYLPGDMWGELHVRVIGGYLIAKVWGRDSGARISDDVAVIKGNFTSGGSIKNYVCQHEDEMIIRLEVSRNALKYLDEEVAQNRYTYKIISE